MKSEFLIALTQLAAERHLPRDKVLEAIEAALASAFKKDSLTMSQNISVKLNPNTGEIKLFILRTVVEQVADARKELSLLEALKIKPDAKIGDTVADEAPAQTTSRIAAQTAKQVVLQRLREAERDLIYKEFEQRVGDIISGTVEQIESGRLVLDMGKAQAYLPVEEQVPAERYHRGQRVKVYVVEVRNTPKGPEIIVSRSHHMFLKRLFELEIPEVYNGVVVIKTIAREAGTRSKVAVAAQQEGIDPVGSCIGMRGNRIQNIVNELHGEKIDVVRWDKDMRVFIANSLSPSEVSHVEVNDREKSALVVVQDKLLSLAIGREGQNARLAAKLTGWHLDIKGVIQWEELKAERAALATAAAEASTKGTAVAEAADQKVKKPPVAAPSLERKEPKEQVPVAQVATPSAPTKVEKEKSVAVETPKPALVEELVELNKEEEETPDAEEAVEEETVELAEEDIWKVPAITAQAGQIRFAEDILGVARGKGGKRDKRGKGRDDSKGRKGAWRGGRKGP